MANPYPALITDANSETRIAGQISFTDPANQPGGESSIVTLTPAMIQASSVTAIELAPAPGVGKGYIDATSVFILGAGFTAYGAAFETRLTLGGTPLGNSIFEVGDVSQLTLALKGGMPTDIIGTWFGALAGALWSGPVSDLNNAPYLFSTASAAPTGGAGNITVVSAMTTITLP